MQNGYEGLMSADGLQKAWFQYQDFLLDKIKLHTVGPYASFSSEIFNNLATDP